MLKHPWYKYILAAVDYTAINLSFFLSLFFYQLLHGTGGVFLSPVLVSQLLFALGFSVIASCIFRYYNLYNNSIYTTKVRQLIAIVRSLVLYSIFLIILSFATKLSMVPESRLTLALFLVVSIFVMGVWRLVIFRPLLIWIRHSRLLEKRTFIVGDPASAEKLFELLKGSVLFKVVGMFSTNSVSRGEEATGWAKQAGVSVGSINNARQIIEAARPGALIIVDEAQDHDGLFDLIEQCREFGVKLFVYSKLLDVIPQYIVVERFGDFSLIDISQRSSAIVPTRIGRVFDIAVSFAALVLLSPFFFVLGAAIKLTSPGPVLYRQTRIGRNGTPFMFYKFRSMSVGSDTDEWRKKKTIEAIRAGKVEGTESTKVVIEKKITLLGRFIRKTSIDELPQLFNVLRGDMSLVGPRPCLPYEWENYKSWHRKRFSVTPGCTGLWQVTARSKVGFDDTVVLDMFYIYNKSIWLDFKIILQTFRVIALGTGGS